MAVLTVADEACGNNDISGQGENATVRRHAAIKPDGLTLTEASVAPIVAPRVPAIAAAPNPQVKLAPAHQPLTASIGVAHANRRLYWFSFRVQGAGEKP